MENQMQAAPQGRYSPDSYRTTARVVGAVYLVGMVVGIGGNLLVQSRLDAPDRLSTVSANATLLAIGAVLWLITVVGDAAHGILMFPVLKRHNERIAVGYLGFRIMDAVFIGLWVLFLLLQIPLGREYVKAGGGDPTYLHAFSAVSVQASQYAYEIAMMFVGIAGLTLGFVLYTARLIPRFLAVWALVGYAIHLGGSVLEVLGIGLNLMHVLPGGLWELFIGVWLIAKGFNASPVFSMRPASMSADRRPSPELVAANV